MEDLYRLDDRTVSSSNDSARVNNNLAAAVTTTGFHSPVHHLLQFDHQAGDKDMCDVIQTQIANHPRFPDLVSAHIECRKVVFVSYKFSRSLLLNAHSSVLTSLYIGWSTA